MPWVDVDEPYAKPPKLRPVSSPTSWSGPLDIDRGWAELADVAVRREPDWDLSGCSELTVSGSVLDGVSCADPGLELEVRRSEIGGCDLSQVRIRSLLATRLHGCKLTGTDLSGATIHDVVFERCHFRQSNLRQAQLRRVQFLGCTFDDVDCFELQAEDVEFPETALDQVNVDRLRAERVDFRGATAMALTAVGSLAGCLVGEHQIPALAYSLVFSVGADVERIDAE